MNWNNILKKEEWQLNMDFYQLDIELIDKKIIHAKPSGRSDKNTTIAFIRVFEDILKETNEDILLIDNYTNISTASIDARRMYIRHLEKHPRLLTGIYVGLNPSLHLMLFIGKKLNLLNKPVLAVKQPEEAFLAAEDFLKNNKYKQDDNKVLEELFNDKQTPKFLSKEYQILSRFIRFYKKENYQYNKNRLKYYNTKLINETSINKFAKKVWNFTNDIYSLKVTLVFNTIVIIEQSGDIDYNAMLSRLDIFDEILSITTNDIIVIDKIKGVKNFGKKAKKIYINYFKKNIRIKAYMYTDLNIISKHFLDISMGRLLQLAEYPIIILKDLNEAFVFALDFLTTDKTFGIRKKDYLEVYEYIQTIKKDKKYTLSLNIKDKILNHISKRYINEMNNYLLSIDWGDTESQLDQQFPENHPFKYLFEALAVIKSDVNELIKKFQKKEKELIKTKESLELLNKNLDKEVINRTQEFNNSNEALKNEIKKREEIEKKIITAREIAINANVNKSIFLANVSHELKTPIHAILSYSNITIRQLDRLNQEKIDSFLDKITVSGQRLSRLLNDLIDLSLIESGDLSYNMNKNNFLDVVTCSISEIETIAKDKDIEIILNYDNTKNYNIIIDKNRIVQVINNLLSNAIKFSSNKSKININIDYLNEDIRFKIEDKGKGIARDEILSIFEEFKRGRGIQEKGTGLGLAISKKIIEYHNGGIWAENGDTGAIFTFLLPNKSKS